MGAEPVPSRGLALAFTGAKDMEKQRTVVYVDGFNLYHGALRHTPYKWLDILSLVKKLIAASQFPAVLHDATGTFHKPARW